MSAILYELLQETPNIKIEISLGNLLEAIDYASKRTHTEREREKQLKADAETLISRIETAEMLNVTTMTLGRWAKVGYLVPVKVGAKVYYRLSDINTIKGKEQPE